MSKRSLRIEYGAYLAELGARNPDIVVLEGDLKASTQSVRFQEAFPDRYFDVGVAEQNMVGIAAGLSLSGKIPFAHSFACFISMRALDQVRTTVAYPRLNVKFVVSHGGISAGSAGTTHHSTEDIAIMRAIANMTVLVPGDVAEMKQVVEAALNLDGPVYIRLSAADVEDVYGPNDRFVVGKATTLATGDDAAIITTGTLAYEGICAAKRLREEDHLRVRVLQMASVKPLDAAAVLAAADETGRIVTVEEHNILGGLGGAVSEIAGEIGKARIRRIGIRDCFCGVGTASYLMKENGLTVENIVEAVKKLLERKV